MSFTEVKNLVGCHVVVLGGKTADGKYAQHVPYRCTTELPPARIGDVPLPPVGTVNTPDGPIPLAATPYHSTKKSVVDLPKPEDGVMLIVTFEVGHWMAESGRMDLYMPTAHVPASQVEDAEAGVHYCHRLVFVCPEAFEP